MSRPCQGQIRLRPAQAVTSSDPPLPLLTRALKGGSATLASEGGVDYSLGMIVHALTCPRAGLTAHAHTMLEHRLKLDSCFVGLQALHMPWV